MDLYTIQPPITIPHQNFDLGGTTNSQYNVRPVGKWERFDVVPLGRWKAYESYETNKISWMMFETAQIEVTFSIKKETHIIQMSYIQTKRHQNQSLKAEKFGRQVTSPGSWVLIPKVLCSHRVVLTQSSLHLGEVDVVGLYISMILKTLDSHRWNKRTSQNTSSQIRITMRSTKRSTGCHGFLLRDLQPPLTCETLEVSTSNMTGLGEEDERRSAHHLDILGLKLSKFTENTSFKG